MKWHVPTSQKLVAFLQGRLGSYSGKAIRKLLEANLCRINGKVERFGSRTVIGGDAVELGNDWKSVLMEKRAPVEILFENNDLLLINKPTNWICTDSQAKKTFGPGHFLVHRLDKDTTGLLIIAKNKSAYDLLLQMFEERKISKQYLAIVDGEVVEESGTRTSLFMKKGSFQGQTIWGSGSTGLTAITKWSRLCTGSLASLILCEPITGRTHQIRVHMAEMGHPILIDRQYATTFRSTFFAKRPLLHAHRLQFSFKGEMIDVTAPLFPDMQEALKRLGLKQR